MGKGNSVDEGHGKTKGPPNGSPLFVHCQSVFPLADPQFASAARLAIAPTVALPGGLGLVDDDQLGAGGACLALDCHGGAMERNSLSLFQLTDAAVKGFHLLDSFLQCGH